MSRAQLALFARVSSWKEIDPATARRVFEAFKRQRRNLTRFCASEGIAVEAFRAAMRLHFADEWAAAVAAKAPKSTPYQRGTRFELAIRDVFRAAGYTVIRSSASQSPADLVAIAPASLVLIQCKVSGALPPVEWNALYRLARCINAVPVLAVKRDPGFALARLTGPKTGARVAPVEPFSFE